MSRIKNCLILIIVFLIICPSYAAAQKITDQEGINKNEINIRTQASTEEIKNNYQPVLAITPREVDLGIISPGEAVTGVFTFKNMGSGILEWSTTGPEGWEKIENQKLLSMIEDDTDSLRFEIRLSSDGLQDFEGKTKTYATEIKLEAGRGIITRQKDLSIGMHKEAIKITSDGGSRTIFIAFKVVDTQDAPLINFNPARIDMGYVSTGKTVSKKLMITNKGKEMLAWSVVPQKLKRNESTSIFKRERYISFLNEDVRGNGVYSVPAHLNDSIDLIGKWTENDGYPFSAGYGNSFKYRFNGTGISLNLEVQSQESNLIIYVDENRISTRNLPDYQQEKGDMLLAEGLADGPHVLTVVIKEGNLKLEGAMIKGKDVVRGPSGWMTVIPNSGTTTSQTNYLTVALNTGQLAPGCYGDDIVFKTNAGDENVEVYVEVAQDNISRLVDIFRYSKGFDYFFTANPQAETGKISQNEYVKEGIAFRLFATQTPGTRSFFRWYNPQKKDHFYHHDSTGGGKNLQGYILEGSIGNIATSKMTNTRELYRWFNPSTGKHFYSTNPKGESVISSGYRFEGIAGYVK